MEVAKSKSSHPTYTAHFLQSLFSACQAQVSPAGTCKIGKTPQGQSPWDMAPDVRDGRLARL